MLPEGDGAARMEVPDVMMRSPTEMASGASVACGLCLAGAITLAALQVVATRIWLGAAVCFVIFVIATNLERQTAMA